MSKLIKLIIPALLSIFLVIAMVPLVAFGDDLPSDIEGGSSNISNEIDEHTDISEDQGLADSNSDMPDGKLSGRLTISLEFSDDEAVVMSQQLESTKELCIQDIQERIEACTDTDRQAFLEEALDELESLDITSMFEVKADDLQEIVVPVAFKQVTCDGETVTTDKDGNYEFNTIMADNDHELIVSSEGLDLYRYTVAGNDDLSGDKRIDSSITVPLSQVEARIEDMGNTMGKTQANRTYMTYSVGSSVAYTRIVAGGTNLVVCNKVDHDYTPHNGQYTNITQNATDNAGDYLSFGLGDSDCAISVRTGLLTLTDSSLATLYPNTIYCLDEALGNIDGNDNIYCNGINHLTNSSITKGSHMNCSWFSPINHPEYLHTHYNLGWNQIGSSWYYYGSNGANAALRGLQTISGHEYYFGTDGVMQTGTVYVNGQWMYFNSSGQREALYTRLAGADRYETSKLIANYNRTSATTAIVISGEDAHWPNAVAAAGLAGLYNAPIISTASTTLSPQAAQALSALGVSRVVLVAGTANVTDAVKNQIVSIVGPNVTRISGADRYRTAEVAYQSVSASSWLHPTGGRIHPYYSTSHTWKNGSRKKIAILVTGTNFPDALAACTLASYTHAPIFLVRDDGTLSDDTKAILQNGNFDEVLAVGGATQAAGQVACGLINPADVTGWTFTDGTVAQSGQDWYWIASGATRYETAGAVFNFCIWEGVPRNNVIVSTGESPADAMSAGTLKHPLLYAATGQTAPAATRISNNSYYIDRLVVLGGTNSVPEAVATVLTDAWL